MAGAALHAASDGGIIRARKADISMRCCCTIRKCSLRRTQTKMSNSSQSASSALAASTDEATLKPLLTRIEARFALLFSCGPTQRASSATLRIAFFNGCALVLLSLVAAAAWLLVSIPTYGIGGWQLFAFALHLGNVIIASGAAISLLVVFAPTLLKLVAFWQRAERAIKDVAFRLPKNADEGISQWVRWCGPKRRAYHSAYLLCCACSLLSWLGHVPRCIYGHVGVADWVTMCVQIPFGAHSVLNIVSNVLFAIQLWLYHLYERQKRSEAATAPAAAAPAADEHPPGTRTTKAGALVIPKEDGDLRQVL